MDVRFVTIDGYRIRYLDGGDPINGTIVLLHGLGGSAERWSQAGPMLARHFRVVIPDLLGFGYSDKPSVDYTPNLLASFVEKFVRATCSQRIFLVGASMGGQVAALYASLHPASISKLVLVSPAGFMKYSTSALDSYVMAAMYPNAQNASQAFQKMEASDKTPDAEMISDFVKRMNMPNAKMAFMSTLLGLKNSYLTDSVLNSINHSTLLVWGSDDPVIPMRYAGYFVSAMRDCTLFRMDGCGHAPYTQQPEIFSRRVTEFVSSV